MLLHSSNDTFVELSDGIFEKCGVKESQEDKDNPLVGRRRRMESLIVIVPSFCNLKRGICFMIGK